jgi:hypothetical protein
LWCVYVCCACVSCSLGFEVDVRVCVCLRLWMGRYVCVYVCMCVCLCVCVRLPMCRWVWLPEVTKERNTQSNVCKGRWGAGHYLVLFKLSASNVCIGR